jgi:DNA-binding response OmpR family regulator
LFQSLWLRRESDSKDVVTGLNAGADEYLTKPVDHAALVARVRSMLRIKDLHDRVEAQAAELASWNPPDMPPPQRLRRGRVIVRSRFMGYE